MKKVFAIVLSVLMLISLCACGGTSIKGSEWKLTGMTTDGLTVDEAFLTELGLEGSISFTDNEVTISVMGETEIGTYEVKDGVITMTDKEGGIMTATIVEETIVVEEEGVGSMIFTRQ